MLVEFEAPSREELEKWLTSEKFHFDWLLRIEFGIGGRRASRCHLGITLRAAGAFILATVAMAEQGRDKPVYS